MKPSDSPAVEQLRQAGLRVTAPRHTVLDWLAENPHSTADQISAGVRQRLGSVSIQGVYDVLAACVDAALVRRIEPAGHPALFERRTGDNHHHITCRRCGRVEDVDCVVDARPCLTPQHDHGFDVDEAEVVFWGTCPSCRAETSPRPTPAHHNRPDERADGHHMPAMQGRRDRREQTEAHDDRRRDPGHQR